MKLYISNLLRTLILIVKTDMKQLNMTILLVVILLNIETFSCCPTPILLIYFPYCHSPKQ